MLEAIAQHKPPGRYVFLLSVVLLTISMLLFADRYLPVVTEPRHPDFDWREASNSVRTEMRFLWKQYAKYCLGEDEINPGTGECVQWIGMAATLIDSLDTLYIMDLKPEFMQAVKWIRTKFRPKEVNATVSVFETIISPQVSQ